MEVTNIQSQNEYYLIVGFTLCLPKQHFPSVHNCVNEPTLVISIQPNGAANGVLHDSITGGLGVDRRILQVKSADSSSVHL